MLVPFSPLLININFSLNCFPAERFIICKDYREFSSLFSKFILCVFVRAWVCACMPACLPACFPRYAHATMHTRRSEDNLCVCLCVCTLVCQGMHMPQCTYGDQRIACDSCFCSFTTRVLGIRLRHSVFISQATSLVLAWGKYWSGFGVCKFDVIQKCLRSEVLPFQSLGTLEHCMYMLPPRGKDQM